VKVRHLLLTALALAGCGRRVALEPAAGAALPAKAETAPRELTADELLATTPEARPARADDPVSSSRPRRNDRFDLPPTD
jgi:hypothetical protein